MLRRDSIWILTFAVIAVCQPARAQVFHGVVLDTESRQPVWVAAVSLIDMENKVRRAAVTDSAGHYELTAPGPGRYKLRVDPRGYRHQYSGEYIVQAGDTVEVNFLVTYEPEPLVAAAEADAVAFSIRRQVRANWFEVVSREP